jgi:hypothetical protein
MHTFLSWWFSFGFMTFIAAYMLRQRISDRIKSFITFRGSSSEMQELRKEQDDTIMQGAEFNASAGLLVFPLTFLFDMLLWPIHVVIMGVVCFVDFDVRDSSASEILGKKP